MENSMDKPKKPEEEQPRDIAGEKSAESTTSGTKKSSSLSARLREMLKPDMELSNLDRVWDSIQIVFPEEFTTGFEDVGRLKAEIQQKNAELKKKNIESGEREKIIAEKGRLVEELNAKIEDLKSSERWQGLSLKINEEAWRFLLSSKDFQEEFVDGKQHDAFVFSIDIRRSTELMLKSRTPQDFAKFIQILCQGLQEILRQHLAVVGKFTGNGVLAFFPGFLSGADAGILALRAAQKCHALFEEVYYRFRVAFTSVPKEVGLGIGIDWGKICLFQFGGSLDIVGDAVVYACRLSGAPGRKTYLNQRAHEKIQKQFGTYCSCQETEIEIKHEGKMLAYDVTLNNLSQEFTPRKPGWMTATPVTAPEPTKETPKK